MRNNPPVCDDGGGGERGWARDQPRAFEWRIPAPVAMLPSMELLPLNASHDDLLRSLQEQDDVWEFVGPLPEREEGGGDAHRLFAVVEGEVAVGIGGLVRSPALDGTDFEVLCAMRSEAQRRGLAKRACQLILAWAFDAAKVERVIACIDDDNEGARSIATKLGMQELCAMPPSRTVYVKYRDGRRLTGT